MKLIVWRSTFEFTGFRKKLGNSLKGATMGRAKGAEAPPLAKVKVKKKDKISDSVELIFFVS